MQTGKPTVKARAKEMYDISKEHVKKAAKNQAQVRLGGMDCSLVLNNEDCTAADAAAMSGVSQPHSQYLCG